jgi:hypothetical protein
VTATKAAKVDGRDFIVIRVSKGVIRFFGVMGQSPPGSVAPRGVHKEERRAGKDVAGGKESFPGIDRGSQQGCGATRSQGTPGPFVPRRALTG